MCISTSADLGSQIRLPVECGGEGHVVEGSRHGIGSLVWRHALDTVLCLVWRQLPPQLIGKDVLLQQNNIYITQPMWQGIITKTGIKRE